MSHEVRQLSTAELDEVYRVGESSRLARILWEAATILSKEIGAPADQAMEWLVTLHAGRLNT